MRYAFQRSLRQVLFILILGGAAGFLRQFAPHNIEWIGRWPTASTSAEDAYKMVAEENDPPFVSLQDAIALQKEKEAVFLDARAPEEFVAGRIPGARMLPYYQMDQHYDTALKGLSEDAPIVVYCEGVGCELSLFLARELRDSGYTDARIFYGGYPEWKEAGLPIEK